MHNKWVIADLHFGHSWILQFCPNREGSCAKEHDEILIKKWNEVVGKRDTVYILGDFAFNRTSADNIKRLKGKKILIGGNHDKNLSIYLGDVNSIHGVRVIKGYWLTHIPVHPLELRGRKNIHGHTHNVIIPDSNYINVCVDHTNGYPILLQDIIDGVFTT